MVLRRSPTLKLVSLPGESEAAFRARLQLKAREARDQATADLRRKYAVRFSRLEDQLHRAEQAIQRETDQATGSKLDAAVSIGSAVLGALFGRKTRVSTALRKADHARRQSGDVARATDSAARVRQDLAALEDELRTALEAVDAGFDAQTEPLEEILLRPRSTDVTVRFCGVAWLPESGQRANGMP